MAIGMTNSRTAPSRARSEDAKKPAFRRASLIDLVETGENRTPRPEYVRQESTTGVAYGV